MIRNLRAMLSGSPMLREPSCLNQLVTEVCAFLASDLASEGIELQVELSASLPRISLAPLEIRQVMINLIGNASQAMSEMPAGERRILIQTLTRGDFIDLHARDHGHGIAPEHLDRIFEPFHTTRPNGLGMGLAICRRVAEAHGGTLKAANHESGAVFTLTLPLVSSVGKPCA